LNGLIIVVISFINLSPLEWGGVAARADN